MDNSKSLSSARSLLSSLIFMRNSFSGKESALHDLVESQTNSDSSFYLFQIRCKCAPSIAEDGKAFLWQVQHNTPTPEGDRKVCEFRVILDGDITFKDVVYAKAEGSNVIVRDLLGETREYPNCAIMEVDVNSTRLVLSRL